MELANFEKTAIRLILLTKGLTTLQVTSLQQYFTVSYKNERVFSSNIKIINKTKAEMPDISGMLAKSLEVIWDDSLKANNSNLYESFLFNPSATMQLIINILTKGTKVALLKVDGKSTVFSAQGSLLKYEDKLYYISLVQLELKEIVIPHDKEVELIYLID